MGKVRMTAMRNDYGYRCNCQECGGKGFLVGRQALRHIRIKNGLSLKEVAYTLGVAESTVAKHENGARDVKAFSRDAYLKAIGAIKANG